MEEHARRKLTAILFSDLVGYSRQMDADEVGTLGRLEIHERLMRQAAADHGGRVIKTVGDAFMLEFGSSVAAVACALDMQRAHQAHNMDVTEPEQIQVRIGVHVGDVLERDGDLFGEAVNIAARLEPKARPGSVCVSLQVLEQVRGRVAARAEALGPVALKNLSRPMDLFLLEPCKRPLEMPEAPANAAGTTRRSTARRLLWAGGGLVGLALLVLAGVWLRQPAPETPQIDEGEATIQQGGTLRFGLSVAPGAWRFPVSAYSASAAAMQVVLEPLVARGEDGSLVPWLLAELPEGDGRELLLHLRPGVWFHPHPCFQHEGPQQATAADLAWSLRLQADAAGLPVPEEGDAGLSVVGDGVSLHLSHPVSFLPQRLATVRLLPRALEGCEDLADMRLPTGTGPFRVVPASSPDKIRMERFAAYWRQDMDGTHLPYLDALHLVHAPEASQLLASVANGELDAGALPESAGLITADAAGRLHLPPDLDGLLQVGGRYRPGVFLWILAVLPDGPGPAEKPAIRQAIAWAIDREIGGQAPDDGAEPMGRLLDGTMRGFDPSIEAYRHDPALARRVLASAGVKLPGTELLLGCTPTKQVVCEQFVADLQAVGLAARSVPFSLATLDDLEAAQSVDLLYLADRYTLVGREPWPYLANVAQGAERQGFGDSALSAARAALEQETDTRARLERYRTLEALLLQQLPVIPVRMRQGSVPVDTLHRIVATRHVHGLVDENSGQALLDLPRLAEVWLEAEGQL